MNIFGFATVGLSAYLLGSVLFSILLSHFFDCDDPRESGSKNPGATNMLRVSSKKMALLTFLGDAMKGAVMVMLARALGADALEMVVIGFMAFLGHVFPLYFMFRGGKGVATGLGVVLSFSPLLGVSVFAMCFITYLLTQYVSLASMIGFALLPIIGLFFYPVSVCIVLAMLSTVLIFSHRSNIQKLINGSEQKTPLFAFQKEK